VHVAASFAERLRAEQVVVGFNVEEAATFPDNSVEYINRVNWALALSTLTHVRLFSYTVNWNKVQIVQELKELNPRFPFEEVWSCYESGPAPCEKCESCQRLARATRSALASLPAT
jgi:7-cyano-7-deazaguanine synthase